MVIRTFSLPSHWNKTQFASKTFQGNIDECGLIAPNSTHSKCHLSPRITVSVCLIIFSCFDFACCTVEFFSYYTGSFSARQPWCCRAASSIWHCFPQYSQWNKLHWGACILPLCLECCGWNALLALQYALQFGRLSLHCGGAKDKWHNRMRGWLGTGRMYASLQGSFTVRVWANSAVRPA